MRVILFCGLLAFASSAEVSLRQRVSPLPKRLVQKARTPATVELERIDVALVSTDYEGLQKVVEDRADPASPRYGQWLSEDEVTGFAQASKEAIMRVAAWMRSVGLEPELNNHRDYLTAFKVPAAKVETLLGAELYEHYDTKTGKTVHRIPGSYVIPSDVAPHVSKVFPIHSVPLPRRGHSTPQSLAVVSEEGAWPQDCKGLSDKWNTPAVTRQRYNYKAAGCSSQSSIAALLPGPVGLVLDDITSMQDACGLSKHPLDKFVGDNHASDCTDHPDDQVCLEAAMDAQLVSTSAGDCHIEFWNGGDSGVFLTMFKKINDAGASAPRVISMSFGDAEHDTDDDIPSCEKEFAKSAAKGITLVSASGDNGAGLAMDQTGYYPNYPPSSQYVLGVGATSFKTDGVVGDEVAAKAGYSAGGFSSIFSAPSWQATFTQDYLKSGVKLPASKLFHGGGRGVPDISAVGDAWAINYRGMVPPPLAAAAEKSPHWFRADGTSPSAPFVASLVARLNAVRLASGKSTMGPINHWLYSTAQKAMNDVTEGFNFANLDFRTEKVFLAAAGWDPITGLGTPNYGILESLVKATLMAEAEAPKIIV